MFLWISNRRSMNIRKGHGRAGTKSFPSPDAAVRGKGFGNGGEALLTDSTHMDLRGQNQLAQKGRQTGRRGGEDGAAAYEANHGGKNPPLTSPD